MESDSTLLISFFGYIILATILSILFFINLFRHKNFRKTYEPITNIEEEKSQIEARINEAKICGLSKLEELNTLTEEARNTYAEKRKYLDELNAAIAPLEDALTLQDDGFFKAKFDLDDHPAYLFAIKQVREEQKQMARDKNAIATTADWTVDGSIVKGRQMANRAIRMTLRAFNNKCELLTSGGGGGDAQQVKKRILNAKKALDKLNESLNVRISSQFTALKIKEVELVSEEKVKKEEERDLLRYQRDREREEAKAQREYIAELKRQEKLERERISALQIVKNQLSTASEEHRDALMLEIEELEQQLGEILLKKGRLGSMAEQTRIGHVYIISNRGAFGENIVKIGMTRRLEPMDRVKELGDASVPFPFDVHAMIFSDDAPALEKKLHEHFWEMRINKINKRKEFFSADILDIEREIKRLIPDVPFERSAPSMEYVSSISNESETLILDNSADTELPASI